MFKTNKKLTQGELLFLLRRRAKRTQTQQAGIHKVSRVLYGRWETDLCKCSAPVSKKLLPFRSVKPHEWCVVFRRRAKLTQEQVAEQVEYCRFTVRKMELGLANCRSLVEYWQNHASQQ